MGFTVEVNGTPVTVERNSCSLKQTIAGRSTFSCTILCADGTPVGEVDDDVQVTEDGESDPIFGGFITRPIVRGTFGEDSITEISVDIDCADYNGLMEHRLVYETIAAGSTLKQAMQQLVPYLSPWSITIAAGQVTGPTIAEAVTFEGVTFAEAVRRLGDLAGGYLSDISPAKVWTMALPAVSPDAPFAVSDGAGGNTDGDLQVSRTKEGYCNRVIVRGGTGTALNNWTQTFTQVGSETEYVSARRASLNINDTFPNVVIIDGAPGAVAGWGPDQLPPGSWYWVAAEAKLVNGTGAALSPGQTVKITHAIYPFVVVEDTDEQVAPTGIREIQVNAPTATTYAECAQIGAAALAAGLEAAQAQVAYPTYGTGLRPGQKQTISSSIRHVSGSFIITDISAVETADARVRRHVQAKQGSDGLTRSWRDAPRRWDGGGAGGGSNIITATVIGGGGSGGGSSAGGLTIFPLALDRTEWVRGSTWVAASENEALIDTAKLRSLAARVVVKLRALNGGVSVTARLRSTDENDVVGTSTVVTSTGYVQVPFNVSLLSGEHSYLLELRSSIDDEDMQAVGGYLECQ